MFLQRTEFYMLGINLQLPCILRHYLGNVGVSFGLPHSSSIWVISSAVAVLALSGPSTDSCKGTIQDAGSSVRDCAARLTVGSISNCGLRPFRDATTLART